ncbi:hypothetical protein GOBAR_AA15304 [Gossypium barbadense]|uniref:Uncharacterized protein n=1 Tax=Gossypium barbadense TaxID=3634 RepID=A0A2P5XPT5_GOSBA|nr:hypothetical protein GOBAR_AA15302 [Gossypium barbadense]PPS05355.1 hypothetical protein GOBAR_AA15304 [Gossypium barbadense]
MHIQKYQIEKKEKQLKVKVLKILYYTLIESEEREETENGQSNSQLPKGGVANNQEGDADVVMEAVLLPDRPRSWKDRLIGRGLRIDDKTETSTKEEDDDDLDLPDEDTVRSSVNGIPTIDFSNRLINYSEKTWNIRW